MLNKAAFHSTTDFIPSKDIAHNLNILFHRTKAIYILNQILDSRNIDYAIIATALVLQFQYVIYTLLLAKIKLTYRTGMD